MLPLLESQIKECCFGSKFFAKQLFKNLSQASSQSLLAIKHPVLFRADSRIIEDKQTQQGIYIFRRGKARLIVTFSTENFQLDREVDANEILGLYAAISDLPYQVTVETLTRCQADFISSQDLMRFISDEKTVRDRLIKILSDAVRNAYGDIKKCAALRLTKKEHRTIDKQVVEKNLR